MNKLYQEWEALSARIKSLVSFLNTSKDITTNAYNPMKNIGNHAMECFNHVIEFNKVSGSSLPENALEALNKFISENELCFQNLNNNEIIVSGLVRLGLLESELSYLLNNREMRIRKTVEIAFAHLQSLIIVDASVQKIWEEGWSAGETTLERLGETHLLLHKIWSFKCYSKKERTDLLLNSVDGHVLTEWKKVENQNSLEGLIDKAQKQISRYKSETLSYLELSNYYYLIMVSKGHLKIRNPERSIDKEVYRIINIVCNPEPPSKS